VPVEIPVTVETLAPLYGRLGRLQHIEMRVSVALDRLRIDAVYPSGLMETVYAEGFTTAYRQRSVAHAEGDPAPNRLAILRDGGWPEYTVELRTRAFAAELLPQSDPFLVVLF
jgi:hypothetical protein